MNYEAERYGKGNEIRQKMVWEVPGYSDLDIIYSKAISILKNLKKNFFTLFISHHHSSLNSNVNGTDVSALVRFTFARIYGFF